MTFKEYWRNYELLTESENEIFEIGQFPQIAQYVRSGKVFISKNVQIKCKIKHKIGNIQSFVSNTLSNLQFKTLYPNDSRVLNFYASFQNAVGKIKYQMVAISKIDGMVVTAMVISPTAYQTAMGNAI
ncbi:MAG: hypothetical protein IJB31_01020 [Akkermansia sp.]|nr:hypothetical protein [Akkermansia sp.]